MAEKAPKNKLVNPYRRCQRDQDQPPWPEPPLDSLAADARPLADAPGSFRDVFSAFRGESQDE